MLTSTSTSTSASGAAATEGKGPALLPVYAQMPVRPVRGRGSWLYEESGARWLDAYGGHAVASTGHCHPAVVAAIREQAEALLFYSTAVPHVLREQLAEALVRCCPEPLRRVFFCNSGAEANENAMHIARKASGRQGIVSIGGGWHGRTVAALAVTDGERYTAGARRAGMPLSRRVPFDDQAALEQAVDDQVAAIIVEPVQGMSGACACDPEFLRLARKLCDERGAFLIFDEVQCGVGRTGAFTAAESFGVTPDLLTMAKGLGSGLPIAALVMTTALGATLQPGDLGSTFGGGPVPCAAALATLEVIEREALLDNVRKVSAHLRERALALGPERVRGVQGRGFLLGLVLNRPAAEVQRALFAHRVLTGTSSDPAVLRLLPPLSLSMDEADVLLGALAEVLK
jgi:acetylornithine/succinyldiaminopimelate/putrescine aminotransferase